MDGDNYLFDLFMEVMKQGNGDGAGGRLRMLSKDPRYAEDKLIRTTQNWPLRFGI